VIALESETAVDVATQAKTPPICYYK
jgi:hypothetical protein